jgi:hypothetical protein
MQLAILVALVGVAAGIILGNFKILILLPAFAVAGAFFLISGMARSASVSCIALALPIAMVGLQLGYLAGIVIFACWPVGVFSTATSLSWQQRHD